MATTKAHVFAEDMTDEMATYAQEVAVEAHNAVITHGQVYANIATDIRAAFEKSYGKGWNCIVGRSFGAFVTHQIKTYMYFTVVPGVYVLLWRA